MSEMIERVRRALGEPHSFRAGEDELSPGDIDEILRRLAVADLVVVPREPTEGMIEAAHKAPHDIYWYYRSDGTPGGPEDAWRAMIDAALAD